MVELSPTIMSLTILATIAVIFGIYLRITNKGFILKQNTSDNYSSHVTLNKKQRNSRNILKLRFYQWFEYDKIDNMEMALKVGDYYVIFETVTVQDIDIFYGKSSPLEVNIMITAENKNHFGTLARNDFIKYMNSQTMYSSTKNRHTPTAAANLDPTEIIAKVKEYVENGTYPKSHVTAAGKEFMEQGLKQPALVFFRSGEDIIVVPYAADDIVTTIRMWLKKVPIEMEDKLISESIDEYLSKVLSKES